MMMKCDVPLPSTPDALDIYLDNIETTVHPTAAATPEPTEGPTEQSTGESTEGTTPNEFTGCQFYEEENGAVFDTGSPYSNNLRPGYLNGFKKNISYISDH